MSTIQTNARRVSTSTSLFNYFLLGLLGVFGLVYVLVAFFTRDLLWFWPIFDEQPSEIIIHCYGQDVFLEQTSPHFLPLTYLINQQISGDKQVKSFFDTSEGYDDVWQDEESLSLEMNFSTPVSVHLYRSFFSDVDALLLVLTGDHTQVGKVFASRDAQTATGYIHLATIQPIVEYIFSEGLCTDTRPCKDE